MDQTLNNKRKLAHGLTEQGLSDLKNSQQNDDVKMMKSTNKKNGSSLEIPAHETHLVHAEIHTPQFNATTGVDEGTKFVQKFYPDEFKRIEQTNGFAGKKVTVLHDPEGDANDVSPVDHMAPQIMSEPGAGTPLDPNAGGKAWSDMDVKDLQASRDHLFGTTDSAEIKSKEALVSDIEEKLSAMTDEDRLKTIERMTERANEAAEAFETQNKIAEQANKDNKNKNK
jgi:hypothetical protein